MRTVGTALLAFVVYGVCLHFVGGMQLLVSCGLIVVFWDGGEGLLPEAEDMARSLMHPHPAAVLGLGAIGVTLLLIGGAPVVVHAASRRGSLARLLGLSALAGALSGAGVGIAFGVAWGLSALTGRMRVEVPMAGYAAFVAAVCAIPAAVSIATFRVAEGPRRRRPPRADTGEHECDGASKRPHKAC